MFTRNLHLGPTEFLNPSAKRLLQQYPLDSGAKADMIEGPQCADSVARVGERPFATKNAQQSNRNE